MSEENEQQNKEPSELKRFLIQSALYDNQSDSINITNPKNARIRPDKIDWLPLSNESPTSSTHKLRQISPTRIVKVKQIHITKILLHISILGLAGIITLVLLTSIESFSGFILDSWGVVPLFIPFGFAYFGIVGLLPYFKSDVCVFDKAIGWFWVGSKKITHSSELELLEEKYHLSTVVAIQVIKEILTTDGSKPRRFTCYELNLVMDNGERQVVMRHCGKNVRNEAKMLSEFLGVPCYDNF